MKRYQPILLLLTLPMLLLLASSCSETNGQNTQQAWSPVALKERTAGLDAGDYKLVKQQAEIYTQQLKTDPNSTTALVGLAQIFMYEARVTGDHPYYYPAALDLVDRALAQNPENYDAVISKASVLLSLHKFSEALKVAEKSVALAPERAVGYGALIDANIELGRYAEAVEAADRMVAIRPDLKSYSRVSYLREIHGESQGAIEAMQLAVDAGAPGSEEKAWAQTALGNLYLAEGDLKKAEHEFRMASLERLDYPFALAGLAGVHVAQGNNQDALALLDKAIALVPEFSFVELQADIHRAAGNNRAADSLVNLVETMLAEDEASGHSMDRELALLYARHGMNVDAAVERAEKELARRPDNVEALDMMAYVLLQAGKSDEARTYIKKAQRMGTKSGTMIAHAGLIEMAQGNNAEGKKLLQQAMKTNPFLPTLLKAKVQQALKNV